MASRINGHYHPKQAENYNICSENMENSFGAINNLNYNYNSEMNQFTEENNINDILDEKKQGISQRSFENNLKMNTFGKYVNYSPTTLKDKKNEQETLRDSIDHNNNTELNNSANFEKINKMLNEQNDYNGCRNVELEKLLANQSFNNMTKKSNDQQDNNIEEFELTLVKVTNGEPIDKSETYKNMILKKIPYKKTDSYKCLENQKNDEQHRESSNKTASSNDEKHQNHEYKATSKVGNNFEIKYNKNFSKAGCMMNYADDNYDVYRTNLDKEVDSDEVPEKA